MLKFVEFDFLKQNLHVINICAQKLLKNRLEKVKINKFLNLTVCRNIQQNIS